MNLKNLCRAAAITLIFAAVQPCMAQYKLSDKSRIGLGVCLVRPFGSQLSEINNLWFGPTLDVNLKHDALDRPIATATIGWFGEEGSGRRSTFVPVKFTYIKRLSEDDSTTWYVGGGVDVYFVNYKGNEYDIYTRMTRFVSESGTPFGVNLMCGRDFGGTWYAELKCDLLKSLALPTGNSVSFSGIALTVGSHMAF